MTTSITDPQVRNVAALLLKRLTTIHASAATAGIAELQPAVVAEISRLSLDALVAGQRLHILTGVAYPADREVANVAPAELEALTHEFIDHVDRASVGPVRELDEAINAVGRVVAGVARYAELS